MRFRLIVGVLIVFVLLVSPAIVAAKPGGPSKSWRGGPYMWFQGCVRDWNFHGVACGIIVSYWVWLTGPGGGANPTQIIDYVYSDPVGNFELRPTYPIRFIDYEMYIEPLNRGHWIERRIMQLPQDNLLIYLAEDQEALVPTVVQHINCAEGSVSVSEHWENSWKVQTYNLQTPYPTAGSISADQFSASGMPTIWYAKYFTTGVYSVQSTDPLTGALVYGNYNRGTPIIERANTYGQNGDTWGEPFGYSIWTGLRSDYVSPGANTPGAMYRTLNPGEVMAGSNPAQYGKSVSVRGSLTPTAKLTIGGGLTTVYSSTSIALSETLTVTDYYTLSFRIVCPSDGPHSYCVWFEGMIAHIWQTS